MAKYRKKPVLSTFKAHARKGSASQEQTNEFTHTMATVKELSAKMEALGAPKAKGPILVPRSAITESASVAPSFASLRVPMPTTKRRVDRGGADLKYT